MSDKKRTAQRLFRKRVFWSFYLGMLLVFQVGVKFLSWIKRVVHEMYGVSGASGVNAYLITVSVRFAWVLLVSWKERCRGITVVQANDRRVFWRLRAIREKYKLPAAFISENKLEIHNSWGTVMTPFTSIFTAKNNDRSQRAWQKTFSAQNKCCRE